MPYVGAIGSDWSHPCLAMGSFYISSQRPSQQHSYYQYLDTYVQYSQYKRMFILVGRKLSSAYRQWISFSLIGGEEESETFLFVFHGSSKLRICKICKESDIYSARNFSKVYKENTSTIVPRFDHSVQTWLYV